jgi:phage/plasmid-associated DNA primase
MSKYPDSFTNLAIQWFESAYPDHAYVRYWLKSLLKGESNPETYLEIAGAGATGKSTLARIAEYMVGSELTLTSTMKDLESRFELSGLRGKSLVLIPDAGKYDGDYSTLKAIVGGDKVRCEYKGIQGDFDFYPQCKVIIATNKALGGSDYSSGLRRRRVLVTPVKVKGFEDTLFKYTGGQYVGVLKDYIPSFMKYILDADTAPVQPISQASHSLILEWALEALVAVAKSRVYIGILKGGTEGLMDVGEKLYPTFIVWCDSTGNRRIPLQDFTAALLDSLDYHGWDVMKSRDSAGVYVLGVQLIVQM